MKKNNSSTKKAYIKRIGSLCILGVFALAVLVMMFVRDVSTAPTPVQPDRNPNNSSAGNVHQGGEQSGNNQSGNQQGGNEQSGNEQGGNNENGPVVSDNTLKENFYTFLIAGTNDNYNTDTIMLGAINTKTLECNIISIPRDSMYETVSVIKRINGAYGFSYTQTYKKAYGEDAPKGIDALREAIRVTTGIYPQYYCLVKMDGFMKIVDSIGGVKFNVPEDLYSRFTGELIFESGEQLLSGEKAHSLISHRGYKMADLERINMQKKFLVTMMQQIKDQFGIKNAAQIIGILTDNIKTNMPVEDMLWFYNNVFAKMELSQDITFHTLPYAKTAKYQGQDYVYLDKEKMLEMLNSTVNPFVAPLTDADVKVVWYED